MFCPRLEILILLERRLPTLSRIIYCRISVHVCSFLYRSPVGQLMTPRSLTRSWGQWLPYKQLRTVLRVGRGYRLTVDRQPADYTLQVILALYAHDQVRVILVLTQGRSKFPYCLQTTIAHCAPSPPTTVVGPRLVGPTSLPHTNPRFRPFSPVLYRSSNAPQPPTPHLRHLQRRTQRYLALRHRSARPP